MLIVRLGEGRQARAVAAAWQSPQLQNAGTLTPPEEPWKNFPETAPISHMPDARVGHLSIS